MSIVMHEIPFPPDQIGHVLFEMQLGRRCTLTYTNGLEDGFPVTELSFDGVEAYKCTYYTANSIDVHEAYGRVLDVGRSDWLKAVSKNLIANGGAAEQLKHLRIFFDDGPCYEFICRVFEVVACTEA